MRLQSDAPGELEAVRALLNTRWSPRRGEPDEDTLDADRWSEDLAPLPDPADADEVAEVRRLREDLRHGEADLNGWLRRYPVRVEVAPAQTLAYRPAAPRTAAVVLALVVRAMADGTWPRLKACPECSWVFYDHSRNATRVWCGMSVPGPNGRSCGAAAKMRSYRARARAEAEHDRGAPDPI
jgi:hypothetical protein